MSVRTIYTCERCKKDQDTESDFYTVGILVQSGSEDFTNMGYGNKRCVDSGKQMQVCRTCLEAMGISPWQPEQKPQDTPPPSLEDLIREIVAATVTDMTGAT